jgi:cell division topological specificity factor MinE
MFTKLKKMFGQTRGKSAQTAKNRLQLVLTRERTGLSENDLNKLKGDLYRVISRYFTINRTSLEIEILYNNKGQSALKVNTPVVPNRSS